MSKKRGETAASPARDADERQLESCSCDLCLRKGVKAGGETRGGDSRLCEVVSYSVNLKAKSSRGSCLPVPEVEMRLRCANRKLEKVRFYKIFGIEQPFIFNQTAHP